MFSLRLSANMIERVWMYVGDVKKPAVQLSRCRTVRIHRLTAENLLVLHRDKVERLFAERSNCEQRQQADAQGRQHTVSMLRRRQDDLLHVQLGRSKLEPATLTCCISSRCCRFYGRSLKQNTLSVLQDRGLAIPIRRFIPAWSNLNFGNYVWLHEWCAAC